MDSLQRNGFKAKMFQHALRFSSRLASLPNKLTPAPFRILQIGSAFWQSRALYVATELGVADVIGDDEMSSETIAQRLQLDEDHLYRLLRMLASIGVFTAAERRCFRNNKLSDCLRRDSAQSVRKMVLLHNSPEMSEPWFEALGPSMHRGEVPFKQVHGEELFDYLDHQPIFDTLFADAMDSVEALTGSDYLDDFDWSRFDRLIDVGGSNGSKSLAILKRHPMLRTLVFDRPQVIEKAASHWQDKIDPDLLERIDFSAGDMMQSIPTAQSAKDIYLFIAVFHAMDDDEAATILANLRTACGSHRPGIAVIECIADSPHIDPTVASFDMQMLIGTRGRERTELEWRALFEQSGFALREIVLLRTFARLLVVNVR